MGLTYQEGTFTIKEYGTSEKAELLLDKSLGLSRQEDGTWAFVGDPYHCTTQNLRRYYGRVEQLSQELSTSYAVEEAKTTLEAQNFFCSENEAATVGKDGLIHMTFERFF
jgi:hypothetical protein